MKKQQLFSFVLATLSFIAAKSLQEVGVENFYYQKAADFQKEDGYFDLNHPEIITSLPAGIKPFTDFTWMDSTHLVCLNEEIGGVLVYDLKSNKSEGYLPTGIDSKVVEVSKVDSTLILVDENMGLHFLLPPYDSTSITSTSLKDENWISSGMCLHETTKRLFFIAGVEGENESSNYFLYTYNLNKRKLNDSPLFEFNLEEIEDFALSNNLLYTAKNKDSVSTFSFTPEVVAIHPKTNEIYVLSSKDRSLAVFNHFGKIVNFTFLDQATYATPKAMTFHPNGDLVLTNSDLMNPSVIRVKWNRLFQSKANHGLIFGR